MDLIDVRCWSSTAVGRKLFFFTSDADAVLGASNILGAMEFALTKFCCDTLAKNLVIICDGKVFSFMQFQTNHLLRPLL